MQERLQKILAQAGFGSRRSCEDLIRDGLVTVNGRVAQLGQKADPEKDRITVDGKKVRVERTRTYIALNKPEGVLSAARDDSRRARTVRDLVPLPGHLYPVGRLDLDSEGLILLTDDGDLTNLLTHPRYEHPKEYRVEVEGRPEEEVLERWRQGIFLDDRRTAPAEISILSQKGDHTWLRVVLREGRKQQIRRVAAILGYPVRRLIRVRIGPVQLGDLRPGQWRPLTAHELKELRELKAQKPPPRPKARISG